MKTTSLFLAISAAFCLTHAAFADNYSTTVGSDRNWSDLVWQPSPGTPGSTDVVTDITAGATRSIYLNGNVSLGELRKTTNTNIRFYNGAIGAAAPEASRFDIGTLDVVQGSYLFRSQGNAALSVNIGVLKLGTPYTPGDPTPAIGGITLDSALNVAFTVAERTELHHRSNFVIGAGVPTVTLGHLVFNNASSLAAQLLIGDKDLVNSTLRVKATSISTAATPVGNTNLVKGSGVLELTGNLGDPNQPGGGVSVFEGLIQEVIRVEKTGSNIQVFSRAAGNTYSGGTLISSGVLAIRNISQSGLGRGEVVVTGQGTLAGNGILAPGAENQVIVGNGGRLAPSADESLSPQVLRLNAVNHGSSPLLRAQDDARFAFNLFAEGNDQISFLNYLAGNFVIEATEGAWVDIGGEIREGVYVLFDFHTADDASARIASGLTKGLRLGNGYEGYTATFHYDSEAYGGIGTIALELRAIPEPGHYALLLLAGASCVAISRKRVATNMP